jgi:hypothetical protein
VYHGLGWHAPAAVRNSPKSIRAVDRATEQLRTGDMPKRKKALEAAQATVNDAAATAQPAWQDSHADGSEGILVRVPSETWRALKVVALDERRSPESVMMEAVDEYLKKHGKA